MGTVVQAFAPDISNQILLNDRSPLCPVSPRIDSTRIVGFLDEILDKISANLVIVSMKKDCHMRASAQDRVFQCISHTRKGYSWRVGFMQTANVRDKAVSNRQSAGL